MTDDVGVILIVLVGEGEEVGDGEDLGVAEATVDDGDGEGVLVKPGNSLPAVEDEGTIVGCAAVGVGLAVGLQAAMAIKIAISAIAIKKLLLWNRGRFIISSLSYF